MSLVSGILMCMLLLLSSSARSGEAGLEGAHLTYQEKYASSAEGIYRDGETLFVITEIPWGKGTTNTLLAKAMLRGKEQLQDYVVEHLLDKAKKPQPSLLKTAFPQSILFGRESVPGLGLPAFDIHINIRVLEDKAFKDQKYRYAIALLLGDLKENIPVGLYGEPSQEEIITAMKKTWAMRKKNDTLTELCRSFGLIEDLLRIDLSEQESNPRELPKGVPPRSPSTVSPMTIAWERSGHADFSVMNTVLSQEYRTASQLYDKGMELPRIITLASRSVELAPANASAWLLLGQALFADNQGSAAIPFLVQSLRINPENADTRAFLAMAYLESEQPDLAKGMAASVFFACRDESAWSMGKATEILKNLQK